MRSYITPLHCNGYTYYIPTKACESAEHGSAFCGMATSIFRRITIRLSWNINLQSLFRRCNRDERVKVVNFCSGQPVRVRGVPSGRKLCIVDVGKLYLTILHHRFLMRANIFCSNCLRKVPVAVGFLFVFFNFCLKKTFPCLAYLRSIKSTLTSRIFKSGGV